jgi:signal transduction histidine kinase
VFGERRLTYVLFAGVFSATFTALFEAQKLPAPAIASIISRDGVFIARSRDPSGLIGRPLPARYLARIRETPAEGRVRRETVEGIDLDSAYKRMALTGWTVDYGLPADTLDAPVRRIAWLGAIVGGAIVLSAIGLALVFARRMAHDTNFLAGTISALGRGEPPRPSAPLRITELEAMRGFAASAGDLLRQREQERTGLLARERAARAEAEAASGAKDQFLGMLGHELRNPLGAIAGAAGVLNMIGSPDERAGRARAVIVRQVQHLSRLVDDLLDVTRVTSGKVRLDRRPLELGSFVATLMTAWRLAGRFDRHDVSVETAPLWVDADETRMEQIAEHLVGNALKYTRASGRIVVRVRSDGDIALLEVSDTGVGIPPELLGRVFDLFVQGERVRDGSQGGLGLGLTLVRALVAMHDGTVDVTSEGEGRGPASARGRARPATGRGPARPARTDQRPAPPAPAGCRRRCR